MDYDDIEILDDVDECNLIENSRTAMVIVPERKKNNCNIYIDNNEYSYIIILYVLVIIVVIFMAISYIS